MFHMLDPHLSYNFTCWLLHCHDSVIHLRFVGWLARWSDSHVTADISLALPWVVVGSDVLRSRTVRREKSVFNRSSYEVGVRQRLCRGGPRWVRDSAFPLWSTPSVTVIMFVRRWRVFQ